MYSIHNEIDELHTFLVDWFTGNAAETEIETGLIERLAPEFQIVMPSGVLLERDSLVEDIRRKYGTNPDFSIDIYNIQILKEFDDHILALYEEWQQNAQFSTPPNNGRLSTVLFSRNPLRWVHVHETWLPPEVMKEGPYTL